MNLIEKYIVIAADGRTPSDFREAFGRKARVTVCLPEDEQDNTRNYSRLMVFAGQIQAFQHVTDSGRPATRSSEFRERDRDR